MTGSPGPPGPPRPRKGKSIATVEAVRVILGELGLDPTEEGLKNTPDRVARMLTEVTQGYLDAPDKILGTVFEEDYDQMVVVKDIPFWSLCEHHMLPFTGMVDVGYLPGGTVVGLSKIPRLVHCFARRLQLQERLTKQIGDALEKHIQPLGVAVVVRGHHTCMTMRGVRSSGEMVTSHMAGAFREKPEARAEFLAFLELR